MANSHFLKGEPEKAIELWEKYKIELDYPSSWVDGYIYLAKGDCKKAQQLIEPRPRNI